MIGFAFSLIVTTATAAPAPSPTPNNCAVLLLADNVQRVVSDGNGAYAVVEQRVAPLLRHVATFLQTHGASPAVTEWTELADEGARVHDEIVARLEILRKSRAEKPRGWAKWWPGGRVDLDVLATDVRLLHHALLRLGDDLIARTPAVDAIAARTRELLDEAAATVSSLDTLNERLEAVEIDGEVRRRLRVLSEDLQMQVQLVQNLDALFTQRTQLNRLATERTRRLLEVILPMEALLGGARLDVSPRSPQEIAIQPPRPARVALKIDHAPVPVALDTVIALSKRSETDAGRARIISRHVQQYARELSAADVYAAAWSLPNERRIDQDVLLDYVQLRCAELSVDDVINLAKLSGKIYAAEMVVGFAKKEKATLTRDDLTRLAAALVLESAISELMKMMASR